MNPNVLLAIPLLPLAAAIVAGLGGRLIGRAGAHTVTCLAVGVSCVLSVMVLKQMWWDGVPAYDARVYTWLVSDSMHMQVGFLIDRLTALMITVVTFVSLCVHVYTIGYMADDPGYQRFFSYISLFTFSMLMLVMSNNFMQLFFGWEAVGLVSYLLIGFWYTRPSAIFANLKAFIVNRIGDFGFVLGIAGIAYYTYSLDYRDAFAAAPHIAQALLPLTGTTSVNALTLICVCLFVGAMGKSAQMPLHVWLPDSMEGPTPISALIHAATMVTAGIFMVARMSPLFELSETALSTVLIIGSTTAFFMGLLGIVNNDIKRVIAYSTLSCMAPPSLWGLKGGQLLPPRMRDEMLPTAITLQGTPENGAIRFQVDKTVVSPMSGCATTSFMVTPFGTNRVAAQWREGLCQGGQILMARIGY